MDYSKVLPINETVKQPGLTQEQKQQLSALTRRDPMDANQFLEAFSQYEVELQSMRDKAEALHVKDDESSASCAEMSAQCRKVSNAVTKKSMEIKRPHLDFNTTITTSEKRLTSFFNDLQRYLEDKNMPYLREKERQRREAEARARAEAERIRADQERQRREAEDADRKAEEEGKEAPPPPPPVIPIVSAAPPSETKMKSDFGSQKIQREWTFEIEDLRLLPDECYKMREKEITAAVTPWIRAQIKAGIHEIPGVRVFQQDVLKTRAK